MKTSKRSDALWKLLQLCDDLHRIRRKMSDPELHRDTRARLRRESKRKLDRLARDLAAYRYRGPLGRLLRECRLSTEDFRVLAFLLHRYLRSEEPACEGRVILAGLHDGPFEILSGSERLHETSPLRAAGLVVLEEDQEPAADALEARFVLSHETIQAFREEVCGGVPEDLRRRGPESYSNNREFLVDLRILHNLYKLRSERAFHQDRWDRVHSLPGQPAQNVTRRIESFWARLRRKLDRSPRAAEFPVVRFLREHGLGEEETIIVVHLFFRELYEGNAYADCAELLRLVSRDESDLIRNRRLFLGSGLLVGSEIVQLEPMLENRELTAEARLSDWTVNYLFGNLTVEHRIHPDERLDWHLYLKNLEDTGTFFRDLEAN